MADIFVAPIKEKQKNGVNPKAHHMRSLSSFSQKPAGVSFQTQKEHESIILFLRAHLITNLSWILITLVLVILPIIILTYIFSLGLDFLSTQSADHFILVFTLFYYLLVFSYVFVSFLRWFYNVFIVTSERVVDIDYYDIVIHNIAVASLSHVQDVNYTQSGFIPTFFDYGDLFVQTAGDEKNFEALSIPKPREATHIIGDLTGIN
jgi:membrane protein YdbS with pleckstrin-like domain